jgi:threonine dehydrogenase-like Zn-dependent dehydrogenase
MAREIWAVSPERCEMRDYEPRPPGEGEVLIRAEFAAAKHGTEAASVKGYGRRGRFDPELKVHIRDGETRPPGPTRVGNMIVGRIEATGPNVDGLGLGDRVVTHSPFREVHTARADRCWKMPEGMAWKSAVCLDPADFAVGAVRDGQVRIGDAVAVFGMGAIGLMVVQAARLSGGHPVIAVDPLANRRAAAVACGADAALDPTACDAGLEVKKLTGGRGADVAIEYSGSVHAMQAALRGVAFGGNVVAGAFPPPYAAGLDFGAEAHLNIPNILFTRACSDPNRDHPRWSEARLFETCWRLLSEGLLTGEPVVTPVVAFEEALEAYPKAMSEPGGCIKLGVRM